MSTRIYAATGFDISPHLEGKFAWTLGTYMEPESCGKISLTDARKAHGEFLATDPSEDEISQARDALNWLENHYWENRYGADNSVLVELA